jgi:hypothetical protein
MSELPDWALVVQLVTNTPGGPELADSLYKKIITILDERIEKHKQIFAEQGTKDLEPMQFVGAAAFFQHHIDPGLTAGLAAAAIYRLARQ